MLAHSAGVCCGIVDTDEWERFEVLFTCPFHNVSGHDCVFEIEQDFCVQFAQSVVVCWLHVPHGRDGRDDLCPFCSSPRIG